MEVKVHTPYCNTQETASHFEHLFLSHGVYQTRHCVLRSGMHTGSILDFRVLEKEYPLIFEKACIALADMFRRDRIDAVLGPARGGNPIAELVARELNAQWIPTNKNPATRLVTIDESYISTLNRKRVLVVDDVLTVGTTVRPLVTALEAWGAEVVGLGVFWVRTKISAIDIGVPSLQALVRQVIFDWDPSPEICPYCTVGIPLTAVA